MKYFADITANESIPQSKPMIVEQLKLSCLPQLETIGEDFIYLCLEIYNTTDDPNNLVYTNKDTCLDFPYRKNDDRSIVFNPNCEIKGDTLIVMYQAKQNLFFSG